MPAPRSPTGTPIITPFDTAFLALIKQGQY